MAVIISLMILMGLSLVLFYMYYKKNQQKDTTQSASGVIRFINGFLDFIWILQLVGIAWTIVFNILIFTGSVQGTSEIHKIPVFVSTENNGVIEWENGTTNEIDISRVHSRVTIKNPLPLGVFVLNLITILFRLLLFLLILYLLRKFVKTLVAGDPFIEKNGIRLRVIAFSTMGFGILNSLYKAICTVSYTKLMSLQNIKFKHEYGLKMEYILLGLLILVIAEVFRIGIKLREENKLTI